MTGTVVGAGAVGAASVSAIVGTIASSMAAGAASFSWSGPGAIVGAIIGLAVGIGIAASAGKDAYIAGTDVAKEQMAKVMASQDRAGENVGYKIEDWGENTVKFKTKEDSSWSEEKEWTYEELTDYYKEAMLKDYTHELAVFANEAIYTSGQLSSGDSAVEKAIGDFIKNGGKFDTTEAEWG